MARVIWPDQAQDDLDQIIAYIRKFDAIAATDLGKRLFDLGESLADFPNRGRPASKGARELATVAPYILRYQVVGNLVIIVNIRHGARQRI